MSDKIIAHTIMQTRILINKSTKYDTTMQEQQLITTIFH